jgi:hypothetical protein
MADIKQAAKWMREGKSVFVESSRELQQQLADLRQRLLDADQAAINAGRNQENMALLLKAATDERDALLKERERLTAPIKIGEWGDASYSAIGRDSGWDRANRIIAARARSIPAQSEQEGRVK